MELDVHCKNFLKKIFMTLQPYLLAFNFLEKFRCYCLWSMKIMGASCKDPSSPINWPMGVANVPRYEINDINMALFTTLNINR